MADIYPKESWYSSDSLWFDCPGCGEYHRIPFASKTEHNWKFDGNKEKPTFSPSVRVSIRNKTICHLFIRNGMIEFCLDCPHELKGKTISLPPIRGGA